MPTHAEKRIVPFTAEQMFDLVADIERYPEFLPWCVGARVRERSETKLIADIDVGYRIFRERFTTEDDLDRPRRIDVRFRRGPLTYLNNHWIFEPQDDGRCLIDFYIDFEFRSRLLQGPIATLFGEAVRIMVSAFERRAHRIYR